MSRVSGPLLDRIDIHIEVPPVNYDELSSKALGTSSAQIRADVMAAKDIQSRRFKKMRVRCNARMSHRHIENFCPINTAGHEILKNAMEQFGLSARAHDKILRIARTIADLDSSESIETDHLHEAIGYRTLDRKIWHQEPGYY